jgi:uncharacterized metal-binding protein
MSKKLSPDCARCPTSACSPPLGSTAAPATDKAPDFCPMKTEQIAMAEALAEYAKADVKEFARQASVQEFECYEHTPEGLRTRHPRIVELIQFSRKMGYKNLGLAFCTGLSNEARIVTDILENQGFKVVSARCKMGAVPKEKIGVRPEEKIGGPASCEPMCNPIAQAKVLNAAGVDFAVILGLCLGHDTLFMQYCTRPMTTLAVKDRVTGHNPLAAIYLSSSYYSRLKLKPGGK